MTAQVEIVLPPRADVLAIPHRTVVSDQDRSRDFYQSVFGADVVRDRDPVILALANTRIVLNVGGGPTDDKPTVRLAPPADPTGRLLVDPGVHRRRNEVGARQTLLDRRPLRYDEAAGPVLGLDALGGPRPGGRECVTWT